MVRETPLPPSDDEAGLIDAARQAPPGDTRAFGQLVALYQRRIVANCRQMTRQGNDAEDLAQEVFVKAYFAIRGFEGKSTFNHWLRRIKVNHCLNHLEREARRRGESLEEGGGDEALAVPDGLDDLDRGRRIQAVLAALPMTLRLPLVMRDMDGLSYEEVAAALGIGLSAVKMRIKRGREEFRRLYGEPA